MIRSRLILADFDSFRLQHCSNFWLIARNKKFWKYKNINYTNYYEMICCIMGATHCPYSFFLDTKQVQLIT
jgi:hypothetical protein